MAVSKVTIRWLNRWQDVEEVVSRSRVKTRDPLEIGMEVQVKYKSNQFKAAIVKIHEKSNTISVMLIYYLLIIAELQRQRFLTNAIKIHLKAGRRVCQHR